MNLNDSIIQLASHRYKFQAVRQHFKLKCHVININVVQHPQLTSQKIIFNPIQIRAQIYRAGSSVQKKFESITFLNGSIFFLFRKKIKALAIHMYAHKQEKEIQGKKSVLITGTRLHVPSWPKEGPACDGFLPLIHAPC